MSNADDERLKAYVEEYKEAGANMRNYVNLRFAQLALFVAISGAILAVLFAKEAGLSNCQRIGLLFFGALISGIMLILECSSTYWWNVYYERARELQLNLGLTQYPSREGRPLKKPISATTAVKFLIVAVGIGWLILLVLAIGKWECAI